MKPTLLRSPAASETVGHDARRPNRQARAPRGTLWTAALLVVSLVATGVSAAPAGRAQASARTAAAAASAADAAGTAWPAGREEAGKRAGRRGKTPAPPWERATSPAPPELVAPLATEAFVEGFFESGDRLKLARLRAFANQSGRVSGMALDDDPLLFNRARDDARGLFKELARDYLRQRLGVDAWLDSLRARYRSHRHRGETGPASGGRGADGPGFDVGPRLRLSDDPELGIEIEGEGGRLPSRLRMTVDQGLASGRTRVRFAYDGGPHDVELSFAHDDPRFGDTIGLGVRFTF